MSLKIIGILSNSDRADSLLLEAGAPCVLSEYMLQVFGASSFTPDGEFNREYAQISVTMLFPRNIELGIGDRVRVWNRLRVEKTVRGTDRTVHEFSFGRRSFGTDSVFAVTKIASVSFFNEMGIVEEGMFRPMVLNADGSPKPSRGDDSS